MEERPLEGLGPTQSQGSEISSETSPSCVGRDFAHSSGPTLLLQRQRNGKLNGGNSCMKSSKSYKLLS